jgi:hypothetical protein
VYVRTIRTGGLLAAAVLVTALSACGNETSPELDVASTAPAVAPPVPVTAEARPAGEGFLEYGLEEIDLTVLDCDTEPSAANANAVVIFAADAEGVASDGRTLRVEVRRIDSTAEAEVSTDTVTILDVAAGTGVVARRFTSGGRVTDIRDPTVRRPLLDVALPVVQGAGLFGPAEAKPGDDRLLGGAVTLTCPG